MPMRRHLMLGAATWAATGPLLTACSTGESRDEAARSLRRPLAAAGSDGVVSMQELVRYATLAPSSYNTQCWKFRLEDHAIRIDADLSRRCPVVDPDDHHVFVSLGCATEQPVEVGSIRSQFASAMGLGSLRPDLVVRFGHGPTLRWSMRRPVQAVLA